jgi:hypothetical protein
MQIYLNFSWKLGLDDATELQALVDVAENVDLTITEKWLVDVWKTDVNAKKDTTAVRIKVNKKSNLIQSIPIVKVDSNSPTNANWRCTIQ